MNKKDLSKDKVRLHGKFKTFAAFFKLGLLIFIMVGIPCYIYFFQHDWITAMSDLDSIKAYFDTYKTRTVFAYIGLQILQIIICVIPGQGLQFVAGYMYGFWFGLLFSLIGATIGSVITYYLAKVLGRDAIHIIFSEERINSMLNRLNSKKGITLVFLIFLIPGIPKDLCNYAAGISDIKLTPFLIVSLLGRCPGMMGSLFFGRQIMTKNYVSATVVAAAAAAIFILCIVFRKKLHLLLDEGVDKIMELQNEEK